MSHLDFQRIFLPKDYIENIEYIYKFLKENEKIIFIVQSYLAQNYLERIFLGIDLILLFRKCILIFTDRRILILAVKLDFKFNNVAQEILYENIKKIELKKNKIIIKYLSGKKEFFRIKSQVAKSIKDLIEEIKIELEKNPQEGHRHYICPNCGNELKKGYYKCLNCGLQFLNKKKILIYSLFLPGYPNLIESCCLGQLGFFTSIIIEIVYILIIGEDISNILKAGLNFNNFIVFLEKIFFLLLIPITGYINAKILFDFIPKKL